MANLILFGPPGSGKGTQAGMIADKYNLLHISTGDLFRYELSNDTELGKKAKSYMNRGALVPDEITISMLRNKVESNRDVKGYIFDGFPRTIPQAEALDALMGELDMEVTCLLALKVEENEIVKRLLERGKDSGRKDDQNEEVIRGRIDVYRKETQPVYDYYEAKGKAYSVNGMGTISEIFNRICIVLDAV